MSVCFNSAAFCWSCVCSVGTATSNITKAAGVASETAAAKSAVKNACAYDSDAQTPKATRVEREEERSVKLIVQVDPGTAQDEENAMGGICSCWLLPLSPFELGALPQYKTSAPTWCAPDVTVRQIQLSPGSSRASCREYQFRCGDSVLLHEREAGNDGDGREALLGDAVWGASIALAAWLRQKQHPLRNTSLAPKPEASVINKHTRLLELGAGVGLPGLSAATIEPPPAKVALSDTFEPLLETMRKNLDANAATTLPHCTVVSIDWDEFTIVNHDRKNVNNQPGGAVSAAMSSALCSWL